MNSYPMSGLTLKIRYFALLWSCLFLISFSSKGQVAPDIKFGELFKAVQLKPVFEDSKTFPDCIPIYPAEVILAKYDSLKKQPGFDLNAFILDNFQLPQNPFSGYKSDTSQSVREHINELWPVLTRDPDLEKNGSLIGLPYAYIVPGGRFREIYYWDSYFTMLGLEISQRYDMIENMVNNFTFLLDSLGFIPNGNRTYYLSRSQPPFYSLMVQLLADIKGDSILVRYLPAMEKEYQFWMDGSEQLTKENPAFRRVVILEDHIILNRYWDDRPSPRAEAYKEDYTLAKETDQKEETLYRNIRAACESGWDFSSRWLRDGKYLATIHTTEIIPVDLNSLMYHLEKMIAQAYGLAGDTVQQKSFEQKASMRKEAIRKYCWNASEKFYLDYDFVVKANTLRPSLAAVYPLFFNISSARESRNVAKRIETDFLQPGGLLTTPVNTKQQWDAPNGWPPLQWIAIKGLYNYGLVKLADEIKQHWININVKVYENTGKLVEKYNVSDITLDAGGGEYPVQDGFGWTNGVLLKLMENQTVTQGQ